MDFQWIHDNFVIEFYKLQIIITLCQLSYTRVILQNRMENCN